MFRIGVIVDEVGDVGTGIENSDQLVISGVHMAPRGSEYPMLVDVARFDQSEYSPRPGHALDREQTQPYLECVCGSRFVPSALAGINEGKRQQAERTIEQLLTEGGESVIDAECVDLVMDVDVIAWLLTRMTESEVLQRVVDVTDRFDGTHFFAYELK